MTALPPSATWRCIIHITRNIVLGVLVGCMWAGLRSSANAAADESNGGSFEMQMVYKYSQEFRALINGRPEWEHMASEEWPSHGTPEFYHTLVMQDRQRRGSRNLLANDSDGYSLLPSNETYYISRLGRIHYTLISLGTPMKTFVVALDTGSDLLWVPCDCQQCSAANWASYGLDLNLDFAVYSPSNSTSSKTVPCNDKICSSTLQPTSCDASAIKPCTYVVKYLSANTSSSGTIVQDVVHLDPLSGVGETVAADIYLGCGTTQTGDFLKGGAPNGLFGLGPEAYSVPRTLARAGVIKDVFSMCFSTTSAVGRLRFGNKPAASLQSTPLVAIQPSVFYVLGIEDVVVGGTSLNISQKVVFDTGTSLTTLPADVLKVLGDAMASKTTLKTWSYIYNDSLQLSYCWNASTTAELDSLPSLSFIFNGGGTWTIAAPFLGFGTNVVESVCLGILPTGSLDEPPILGFNFMTMYEYFFDLEASTFSWSPSDCSGFNSTTAITETPIGAPSASPQSSPSRKSPSISPSKDQESPLSDAPQVSPQLNSANASSLLHLQLLLLLALTTFFHLQANQSI